MPDVRKGADLMPTLVSETRVCSRCGERLPLEAFYFVSKKLGTRRGKCKPCMAELKAQQKDPHWKPSCSRCGTQMERFGPGRRLCTECFDRDYDREQPRVNGSHRLRLKDCRACGAKRLHADHEKNTALCAICRSVGQGRRTRLSRLYNMTPREFIEMLESQRHRCAICLKKSSRPLHVDHQHAEPLVIRGAICASCNTILGLARDSPERLRAAADYLEVPPAQALFPGRAANLAANRSEYRPVTRLKRAA